jgi:hypothetical protein
MARAVPSASEPIRNTTALPVRSTPHASANTFGRPSNTKPTTPSGALRTSTDHPSCSTRPTDASRRLGESRQPRSPSIMPARMAVSSTSRVVDRPSLGRLHHVRCVGCGNRREHRVVGHRLREAIEEVRDLVVAACSESAEKPAAASPTATWTSSWTSAGTCRRTPVDCTTRSRSPARNRCASSASTYVTRLPPNGTGCPATRLLSASIWCCGDTQVA